MPTLTKRATATQAKRDYIVLMPPGDVLREKIFELGLDVTELAKRCKLPLATIQGILDATTEMTQMIAEKLEHVTWIQADSWMRMEENYRKRLKLTANADEYTVDDELSIAVQKSYGQ
jgi:addiction module HigA family antidote